MLDLLLLEIDRSKKDAGGESGQNLNQQYEDFLQEFKDYTESIKKVDGQQDEGNFEREHQV